MRLPLHADDVDTRFNPNMDTIYFKGYNVLSGSADHTKHVLQIKFARTASGNIFNINNLSLYFLDSDHI